MIDEDSPPIKILDKFTDVRDFKIGDTVQLTYPPKYVRVIKMTRDEFREEYPDVGPEVPKPDWVISRKITELSENRIVMEDIIDLNHPECPIVKWEPVA